MIGCLLINALGMIRLSSRPWTKGEGLRQDKQAVESNDQRLAVVVPAHGGDLRHVLTSVSRWPTLCSQVTLRHVELVLYYSGAADDPDWSGAGDVLSELEQTGGRCFARTNVLFGNLTEKVRQREEITFLNKTDTYYVFNKVGHRTSFWASGPYMYVA